MSIESVLEEVKEYLEPYLHGMVDRDVDFEGLPVMRRTPNIFINNIRDPEINEDEDAYAQNIYPFVMLRAISGNASDGEGKNGENEIAVIAVIGVHDPGEDKQGIAGVHNIIDRIISAVMENPYTKTCTVDRNVSWMADDDDSVFPYFYGTATITVHNRLTTRAEYDI